MKKILTILMALTLSLTCLFAVGISASAAEETKVNTNLPTLSSDLLALFKKTCPFCSADIEDEMSSVDTSKITDIESIKFGCPECKKEINVGNILVNGIKDFAKKDFPDLNDDQLQRIFNVMLYGKCPDCGEQILKEGQNLVLSLVDSSDEHETESVAFDSLECSKCGFKGANDPALKANIEKLSNDFTQALFQQLLPELSGWADEMLKKSKEAKIYLISAAEAKNLKNVTERYDLSNIAGTGQFAANGVCFFDFQATQNDETRIFHISSEDFDLLDSFWDNKDGYSMSLVKGANDDYSIYFYPTEGYVAEDNELTTEGPTVNVPVDEGEVPADDGSIAGTNTESSNNPKTGDNIKTIVAVAALAGVSAAGIVLFRKRKESN